MTASAQAATPVRREVTITRLFDAPRRLVFRMWIDPHHVAQWWGPRGFVNPVCEIDARPGGAIRIVMRGPDGGESPVSGIFDEVAEPERLVFTARCGGEGRSPLVEVRTTVTFAEQGGKTKVTVHASAVVPEGADAQALEGMEEGWAQTLVRLDDLLQATAASDREIVLSRVLDAPRDLVWQAWTDPAQVVQWWGPQGFTTTTREINVRPGGVWRFVMHGPDGRDYLNRIVFDEVVRPERLTYRHAGEGADEGVNFTTTVTFAERGGRTELTLRMVFPSTEDRDRVIRDYGAIEGGKQTLARLADHVARM
jgi:uncharacterized protein YndB with AHSA1/START domain